MSVRRVLTRNTAFNAAGRLWEALVTLVLTPYIVERVGVTAWGLWALISVFTGYIGLLDFGMASGFAKYIAEHAARHEDDRISSVVSTGFFFYLLLGVLLVVAGWPCIDFLVALMGRLDPQKVPDLSSAEFLADIRFLLRWAVVLFAASNAVAPFTAIQTGLQRMGVTNLLSFGASLIKIVATVLFLEMGYGIRGLLYSNAIVFVAFATGSIAVAFCLARGLRLSPTRLNRQTFRQLFSFGWRTQVAKLCDLIMFQTDKLIVIFVYKYLGLVGLYDLGVGLANKMRQVPTLLVGAILPAASDLDARGEEERLGRLYLRSTKYIAAVTVPLVAFTVGAAHPLMRTWLGEKRDLAMAAWVLRIIALGYVANILPGPGVSIALGKGRAGIQMRAGLISMVSNILLTIALVWSVGFYGIPVATSLSMVLSCAWFFLAMRAVINVGAGELLRGSVLWPAVAALPGFVVCVAGDWLSGDLVGRAANGAVVTVCGAALGLSYLGIIRFTPFLDAFDLEFLEETLLLGRIPGFRFWARRKRRA